VLREAQAAARLNHPGIVTLYEMGEEEGNALLVSELVHGSTLAELGRAGELSDREIGEIGADLCEALDYAHAQGVVHRDIKPQNVLVTEDSEPRAKLMDFGVARLTDATALTAPGDVVGTLAYMAPEQAEGRTAGPEADVYSLALTLYECWGGENPNRRATPAATARAIGRLPRPLRRLRPDLPRELSETIDACLSPRPARRPGLEELGAAVEDSLELLADSPPRGGASLRVRVGVAAAAALFGAWLAVGHGLTI
jgi:serine/threonine protein kinase